MSEEHRVPLTFSVFFLCWEVGGFAASSGHRRRWMVKNQFANKYIQDLRADWQPTDLFIFNYQSVFQGKTPFPQTQSIIYYSSNWYDAHFVNGPSGKSIDIGCILLHHVFLLLSDRKKMKRSSEIELFRWNHFYFNAKSLAFYRTKMYVLNVFDKKYNQLRP